jgi:glycosyltransferase involved in cell wall biosynthesis
MKQALVTPSQRTPRVRSAVSAAAELPRLAAPTVSVIVCNYNYERYLTAALESVLSQTRRAYEVIAVDDGSTDNSRQILESFEARGVQVIVQENAGQVAAYNTGFQHATGDVVLFLDSDDVLLPWALEKITARFDTGVAKVHFRLELISGDGTRLRTVIPAQLASGEVALRFLKHGIPHASPPASGNAYRRAVLARIFPLPIDQHDRHGADFFCIYASTLFGRVAACDETLGLYRVHSELGADPSLTFGNAQRQYDVEKRSAARIARFSSWIAERTTGRLSGPDRLRDFSLEKTLFAQARLAGNGPLRDLRAGLSRWPRLLKSIGLRKEYSASKKLGLIGWSVLVLIAPRPVAVRAARYVCSPANRK